VPSDAVPSQVAPNGATNESVIHDIGFRHYDGPRLGRGWAFRSLLIETLRGSFGLGRPSKVKVMPWVLTGLLVAPALIMVALSIVSSSPDLPLTYTQYAIEMWLLIAMFVAGRAPYAVSRDLRDGVMPLYLSRPILRRDYVLAKFLGLSLAVFVFLLAPLVVLLVGSLLAKYPAGHELWTFLGGVLMAAVLAILLAAISLVLASFTKRRGFGVAAIMTTLVLVSGFANILVDVVGMKSTEASGSYFAVLDPFLLVDGLAHSWLGVEPAHQNIQPDGTLGAWVFSATFVALVGLSLLILMRRFKKVGGV
jgi:ABC-2 type transport system permease protein